MGAFIKSRYFLWALLSIPMIGFGLGLTNGTVGFHKLLHPTGEFSTRFMIIAMLATPFVLIFKGKAWTRWLVRHRRYFGVAAFCYGAVHTIFYVLDKGTWSAIWAEALDPGILTGWIAMLVFIPLGLTSNDYSVRTMGTSWKALQRWVYLAAAMTLGHWMLVEGNYLPALIHFGLLGSFETWRLVKQRMVPQA